jgi:release factor glutamine methyltransferase
MNRKNWLLWRNKPIDLQGTRQHLRIKLTQGGFETPGNTSLILLKHALNQPKSWILSHGDYQLSPHEDSTLQKSLNALLQGMPLPYVLGYWEFYGRTFHVTPDVLIPRPETERLVEKAIEFAQGFLKPCIIDVGTGSGAIAISLAAELPGATILGADLSISALRVAQTNAQHQCQLNIHFIQGDLLTPFSGPFDLICANLPYIPRNTLPNLAVSNWEPCLALDGGETGLDAIQQLLRQAQTRLSPSGVILLETDASLGHETLAAAQRAFPKAQHRLIQDLAGHDRLVEIHLKTS